MNLSVAVITLGCAKNSVETDYIKGTLKQAGYQIIDDPSQAEIIVVNTCGFIEPAKQESIDTILELAEYKKDGLCRGLIVAGCLGQRYPEQLFSKLPEVDAIIGIAAADELLAVIERVLVGERIKVVKSPPLRVEKHRPRDIPTSASAYLQIADGCDNFCAYCTIPLIRGRYRSRSLESLLKEAEFLVERGVKEINLIAQDITQYGTDTSGLQMLDKLVNELYRLKDLKWIRLLYVQPQGFSNRLLSLLTENAKVCKYVDIPFQHASNKLLRKMKRQGTQRDYSNLIRRLRKEIPEVVLRTSVIVGFPGETEADFQELVSFIKEVQFDRLGVFQYSAEEGTAAFKFSHQISSQVKQERYDQLLEIQETISFEKNKGYLGKEFEVLIEDISNENGFEFEGRSFAQAPEVDGLVLIGKNGNENSCVQIGDFVKVKVKAVEGYDLIGEIIC